ncbi:helix-turn-helix domain-containing protein [Emcibacter nanhaiensis]|uniref:Helix-turn-helix domain-containing protein n=1 Tax=Emcibacter nanhaiensis TaxID=1505037 RepID=A0A501P976_9PROT|nr:helix-turn-helix domain-containing protein [Emcibacter nanhaiensis]TPD56863.1 helix-turn-helix domain-containing protein [Emcibacter nanhaiensis]
MAFDIEQSSPGLEFDHLVSKTKKYFPWITLKPLGGTKNSTYKEKIFEGNEDITVFCTQHQSGLKLKYNDENHALRLMVPISGGGFRARVDCEDVICANNVALVASNHILDEIEIVPDPEIVVGSVVFNPSIVDQVLCSLNEGGALEASDYQPTIDLSSEHGRVIRESIRILVLGMDDGLPTKSSKAYALYQEATLHLLLEHFLRTRCKNSRYETQAQRAVRQAVDYMHAYMGLPLTIGEIANEVGVCVRSLEYGFRHYMETTPKAYLQSIRLAAAHKDLSNPSNNLLVKSVALKWGFTQMGRFSAQYFSAYGERPSETRNQALKRR